MAKAVAQDAGKRFVVDDSLYVWRYKAALEVGLDPFDARTWAESRADIGLLRWLHARGCPPDVIARIVI
jgi:hypothetical protein